MSFFFLSFIQYVVLHYPTPPNDDRYFPHQSERNIINLYCHSNSDEGENKAHNEHVSFKQISEPTTVVIKHDSMTSTYTCEEETHDKKRKQPVIKVMLPGECKQHVPLIIKAAPGCWPP